MKRLIVLLFPRMECKSVTATLKEFRGGLLVHFETVLASIAASICILPDENRTYTLPLMVISLPALTNLSKNYITFLK